MTQGRSSFPSGSPPGRRPRPARERCRRPDEPPPGRRSRSGRAPWPAGGPAAAAPAPRLPGGLPSPGRAPGPGRRRSPTQGAGSGARGRAARGTRGARRGSRAVTRASPRAPRGSADDGSGSHARCRRGTCPWRLLPAGPSRAAPYRPARPTPSRSVDATPRTGALESRGREQRRLDPGNRRRRDPVRRSWHAPAGARARRSRSRWWRSAANPSSGT